MKKISLIGFSLLFVAVFIYSCKEDFLERTPPGSLSASFLSNTKGAEALLIGAYAVLDGFIDGGGVFLGGWQSSGTNWVYGSVAGGEAHKGSEAGDQPDINPIERFDHSAENGYFNIKWQISYEGVNRSNNTLKALAAATDATDADKKRIAGQARFLRGHYHFELKKMYNKVPYIDETITDPNISNEADIWPQIEADLKFAYDNLPETMNAKGRINKWTAGALYGKSLLFQKKFAEARTVLNDVYTKGMTATGTKYALLPKFQDNFNAETKNSSESVFAVQYSVNDGANGSNGGWGEVLNFPHNGGPGGCCGFFQPTQDFVNSFQVDAATGLPNLANHNVTEVKSDYNIKSSDPFTPEARPLDSRLDWTVGRRGIQYLDWGPHPGSAWIRDQSYGGPYAPKKNVYYKSQQGSLTDKNFWTSGVTANNYSIIRFSDVILMLAEAEIEVGSLAVARDLTNMVRARAANPVSFVKDASGAAAANYKVGVYSAFTDQAMARTVVRFERKLELGMEGHRFFDLVRWGIAAAELNRYLLYESTQAVNKRNSKIGATFKAGKTEYYPIPQAQIDFSAAGGAPKLKQNPGY